MNIEIELDLTFLAAKLIFFFSWTTIYLTAPEICLRITLVLDLRVEHGYRSTNWNGGRHRRPESRESR